MIIVRCAPVTVDAQGSSAGSITRNPLRRPMKVCPECGATAMSDDDEFCVKCGAMYPKAGAPAATVATKVHVVSTADPVERGFVAMSSDNFAEAVKCWTEAAKAGTEFDTQTYNRILEKTTETMLRIVVTPDLYRSARLWGLAATIDQDILTDLMDRLSASIGVCTMQSGVLGLSNGFMFLYIDCFNVYTDLRDLLEATSKAVDGMNSMCEAAKGLPEGDITKPGVAMAVVEAHRRFAESMHSTITGMIADVGEDRLEELSDYWASKSSLPYPALIFNAFNINAQLSVAGKLSAKLLSKTRDMEIQTFSKTYLAKGS